MVFLFLGCPSAWDKGVAVATGLVIIIVAYRGGAVSRAKKSAPAEQPHTPTFTPPTSSTFVENKDII